MKIDILQEDHLLERQMSSILEQTTGKYIWQRLQGNAEEELLQALPQLLAPDLQPEENPTTTIRYYGAYRVTTAARQCVLILGDIRYLQHQPWYRMGTTTVQQIFALGWTSLPDDFGALLIRPETWADTILDAIYPVEYDFPDHPEFSNLYYFLASSSEEAQRFARPHRLDALSALKDAWVSVRGSDLLAFYDRAFDVTDTLHLVEFLMGL